MRRNADRLLRLTDQIMDLRKIDRGKMELTYSDVALSPFVKGVVAYTEDIAQSRRQTLTFVDNTNGHTNILLDTDAFEKILLNLLSNALKYTPENGSVTVSIDLDPKTDLQAGNEVNLLLNVTDTGIGIPPAEKERIFERFYRVDKSRSRSLGGTGLGLSIVKHAAKYHNASVLVTSEEGCGSTFTVVFEA